MFIICAVFFLWTATSTSLLQLFSCMVVDPETPKSDLHGSWLVADATQKCFTGPHLRWFLGLAVPGSLLVIIGVPAFIILTMRIIQAKGKLNDRKVIAFLGFIFYGYKAETPWWEAVIMFRKIALVATAVFLTGTDQQSISLQLSMMMGIIFCSLVAQVSYRPHTNRSLYRLEVLSLCGSFLTVYCGSFFYGPAANNMDLKIVLSSVLIGFNIIMLSFFVGMIGREVLRSQLGLEKARAGSGGAGGTAPHPTPIPPRVSRSRRTDPAALLLKDPHPHDLAHPSAVRVSAVRSSPGRTS